MIRFVHPLKLKKLSKEKLLSLLKEFGSQHMAAKFLGVSQMTVSRQARRLGIKHDGRPLANKSKSKIESQSEKMKKGYASGKYSASMKGRKHSESTRKKLSKVLKGKVPWNLGLKKFSETNCEICGTSFLHSLSRKRRFCSRKCSAVHFRRIYSDGRFLGKSNPNFGNRKVKEAWKAGKYEKRQITNNGWGKGGRYKGIWLRSSWEIEFAKNLDEAKLFWEYEPKKFRLKNGKYYTPDFYIPSKSMWIEIKGWWTESAKQKFSDFKKEFPKEKIIVIDRKPLWHRTLNG
jgi:endogenous inhibitor of DNA gyrase (YacG/DUF329 family)